MGRWQDLNKQFAMHRSDYVIFGIVIVLVFAAVLARDRMSTDGLIRVGIVSWPGYAGGLVANNGLDPDKDSLFWKDYGLLVKFEEQNDTEKLKAAFARGDLDIMWSTVDTLAAQIPEFAQKNVHPVALMQVDWSHGGDAVVGSQGIASLENIRGHKLAVSKATVAPSRWLLEYSLERSISEADWQKIAIVETKGSHEALASFLNNDADAAVLWEPDVTEATTGGHHRPGSHTLIDTSVADNLIADVMIARREFVANRRSDALAFVKGWLRGAEKANRDPMLAVWALEHENEFAALGDDKTRDLLDKTKLATLDDNVEMFGLANTASRFDYIFDHASTLWLRRGIITAKARAEDARDTSLLREIYHAPSRICESELLPMPVTLTFAPKKAEIAGKALGSLKDLSRSLDAYSKARFLVQAEISEKDTFQSAAFALSREREDAVINYLVMQGNLPRRQFVSSRDASDHEGSGAKATSCIRLQLLISESNPQ